MKAKSIKSLENEVLEENQYLVTEISGWEDVVAGFFEQDKNKIKTIK